MSSEERTKWDRKHAERGFFPAEPSRLITDCAKWLPERGGRVLDVAGGSGRHSLWLAERGFEVTLADISEAALRIAGLEAEGQGAQLGTLCLDFDEDPFPSGPWDVILCFHFLHRPLFDDFARHLSSKGVLLFVQPTLRNLQRHARPSQRYLLAEGEIRELAIASALKILHYSEDWSVEGRHEAVLVAEREDAG